MIVNDLFEARIPDSPRPYVLYTDGSKFPGESGRVGAAVFCGEIGLKKKLSINKAWSIFEAEAMAIISATTTIMDQNLKHA